MIESLFRTIPDGTQRGAPRNPYRMFLGGGTIALYALAVLLVVLAFAEILPVGLVLAPLLAAVATLFLIAWLVVGALQWRAPETPHRS